jgi:hypothetical protein
LKDYPISLLIEFQTSANHDGVGIEVILSSRDESGQHAVKKYFRWLGKP